MLALHSQLPKHCHLGINSVRIGGSNTRLPVQDAIKRRDGEIHKLATQAEKGPDSNHVNLRFKNETNEGIILQLNSQVRLHQNTFGICRLH